MRSGDSERALPHFATELKINPNDFWSNFYLGLLKRRNNKQDEALPYFLRALQLRPKDISAAYEVSLIHLQKGNLDRAREMLEEMIQRTPDFMDAHVNLARIYYRKKMKTEGDREQEIVEKLRIEQQKQQPGASKGDEAKKGESTARKIETGKGSP
jgi:tetratricopeptide (TPR) repeat protein